MFVIVEIAGQQFKVEKGRSYFVHRLQDEVGSKVSFNKVMLAYNDNDVIVGNPIVEGITVNAEVLEHLKGDKVIVFKKKRRKGYRVKNGHRQCFTKILVQDIIAGEPKKTRAKKTEPKVEEAVVEQPANENNAE
jgi:large subunit ribosomal protein L21